MKKIAILYFSGTGNTKYIAEKMKEAAIEKNYEVDLINIEKDKMAPSEYEHIVIGGPVYVERYPEILLKYIESNLGNYKGTCMLFSTQAFDGHNPVFKHAGKRLKKLNITYSNYLPMPNNFYNFMFKRYPEDKQAELINSSSVQAQKMVLDFLDGKTNSFDIPNSRVILAEMAYKFTYPFLRKFLMRNLDIDRNKCVKCKICERFCPAKCIRVSPKLKINNNCTFCQRCLNNCPKNAFLYKGKPMSQYKLWPK